jgi:hypothetical protein
MSYDIITANSLRLTHGQSVWIWPGGINFYSVVCFILIRLLMAVYSFFSADRRTVCLNMTRRYKFLFSCLFYLDLTFTFLIRLLMAVYLFLFRLKDGLFEWTDSEGKTFYSVVCLILIRLLLSDSTFNGCVLIFISAERRTVWMNRFRRDIYSVVCLILIRLFDSTFNGCLLIFISAERRTVWMNRFGRYEYLSSCLFYFDSTCNGCVLIFIWLTEGLFDRTETGDIFTYNIRLFWLSLYAS